MKNESAVTIVKDMMKKITEKEDELVLEARAKAQQYREAKL